MKPHYPWEMREGCGGKFGRVVGEVAGTRSELPASALLALRAEFEGVWMK